MVTISRPINGIPLNGQEYLMTQDGSLAVFEDIDEAMQFLELMGAKGTYDELMDQYNFNEYEVEDV
jgi:hypothetical protein